MTERINIEEAEAALAKMTPEAWRVQEATLYTSAKVWNTSEKHVATVHQSGDIHGIVYLRNTFPALLTEVRELRAQVEDMTADRGRLNDVLREENKTLKDLAQLAAPALPELGAVRDAVEFLKLPFVIDDGYIRNAAGYVVIRSDLARNRPSDLSRAEKVVTLLNAVPGLLDQRERDAEEIRRLRAALEGTT